MPARAIPLISGEIYHVFNRSIARQPIFTRVREYQRFFNIVDFYKFQNPGLRYSHYNRLREEEKIKFIDNLHLANQKLVEIIAFSFMPNHYHFLLKQIQDDGIKICMSQIQNSYAKYFNTNYKRTGSLFQEMFKAIRIESDEQLIHVVRYIHLNPLTSYVIKEISSLENYPWTSFIDYLNKRNISFIDKDLIRNYFSNAQKLRNFTLDQVDYQRTLADIQHLTMKM